MRKSQTKLNPATVWAEAFPIYFALSGRVRKFKFHLACDDDLHGLVSPEDIRAWQRKMTRKSYVTAWAKTHKKKATPESRLAAKLKRCGVSRG
jgi:hypothetical protein